MLLSGGIDSSTLLYHLINRRYDCLPLTIDYGQKHIKEASAAKDVCVKLGISLNWKYLDLSNLKHLIQSALHGVGEIPSGHYSSEAQKLTVSPNRNMIFLAIAAGYAQTVGAEYVGYAAHSNDRAVYPDCRPEFVKSVGETVGLGTGGAVEVLVPFVDWTKTRIVDYGVGLGVPYQLTWSCYCGEERPCLCCGTCLERTEAFDLAGHKDPALTDEEWDRGLQKLRECVA